MESSLVGKFLAGRIFVYNTSDPFNIVIDFLQADLHCCGFRSVKADLHCCSFRSV